MGTYCGWCGSDRTGHQGTSSGPTDGSKCASKDWIWVNTDCPAIEGPQQIHVAWTNTSAAVGEFVVSWTDEKQDLTGALVTVAAESSWPAGSNQYPAIYKAFGPTQGNPSGVPNYYTVTVSGLQPNTRYTYSVTSGNTTSGPFTTQTKPRDASAPVKFLVFGDMGRHGGGFILTALEREVAAAAASKTANNISAIIHIGGKMIHCIMNRETDARLAIGPWIAVRPRWTYFQRRGRRRACLSLDHPMAPESH